MMTSILVVALLIAGAAGIWWYKRFAQTRAARIANGDYRAVSIEFDPETACPAAMRLEGHRFLCGESPPLPLPVCKAATCNCRFEHHEDRRAGPRRTDDMGIFKLRVAGEERRSGSPGRRAEDRENAPEEAAQKKPEFDPAATYYDFVEQTGITPGSSD